MGNGANVRLIAVNEGVDTGSEYDDDFLPFRDVINEYYAKDIGKKIKLTFKAEKEPTPEELRKREARKDKLHQNYLKRKANGKQKEYEERTKAKKKAQIDIPKEQIRAEDRGNRL